MTKYLYSQEVRIFDYPRYAEQYREIIRENIEKWAEESGIKIEFFLKSSKRKETIIAEIIKERGSHVGIVHIISAMESRGTYKMAR